MARILLRNEETVRRKKLDRIRVVLMKKVTQIAFISSFLLAGTAYGVPISTTDGIINSINSTVAFGEVASYVSGGTGLTGRGLVWPMDAGDGLGNVSQPP